MYRSLICLFVLCIFVLTGCETPQNEASQAAKTVSKNEMSSPASEGDIRILYYTNDGWPACVTNKPVIKQIKEAIKGKVEFVENDRSLAGKFGVTYIPTFIITDSSNKELYKKVGADSFENYRSALIKAGVDL